MSSWFWRPILKLSKRRFPVNLLTQSIFCRKTFSLLSALSNLQILWIKYNSKQTRFSSKFEYCQYFLSLLNELTIVSVFLKKFVLVISYETIGLIRFHSSVSTFNQENVFSRSYGITSPHSTLCGVICCHQFWLKMLF